MSIARALAVALATGCIVMTGDHALAQVPPHTPGTICFTPKTWCWAKPPGPPGRPCACKTPNGWVSGRLG